MQHEQNLIVQEVLPTDLKHERFPKRHIICTDTPGSDTKLKFLLKGDNVDLGDDVAEGEEVSITFHLEGRAWDAPDGRTVIFTDLVIDKLENLSAAGQVMADVQPLPQPEPVQPAPGEDVPF